MAAKTEFIRKISYLRTLEGEFSRLLSRGENKKAAETIAQVIEGYNKIGARQNAKRLLTQYGDFIAQFNIQLSVVDKKYPIDEERADPEKVLRFIEALEKKVRRRLLQGKTDQAISDLKFIISKLRELHHHEKADLLETTLNQFIIELSGTKIEAVPVAPKPPTIQPIHLPNLTKKPSAPPPSVPTLPPIPRVVPNVPPPPIPTTKSTSTIKDLPLSEEEEVLKKLFDIKDLLSRKSK
ncbi:MAG: hypothetical protein HWN65_10995 [Candidatus Helarchaeota archaeon]|nr:hypothetical protein [Candidatus Helarchaeota archaeon]